MTEVKLFRVNSLLLIVLLSILFFCPSKNIGQSMPNTTFSQKLASFEVKEQNLTYALSKITHVFKIPIRLELKNCFEGEFDCEKRINVNITNASLFDVLDAILKQDADYELSVSEKVISVFPKTKRDEIFSDLLKTKIQNFSIETEDSKLEIRKGISSLPEVKEKLDSLGLSLITIAPRSSNFEVDNGNADLSFKETTLKDILDTIILQSSYKLWVIHRWGEKNDFVAIELW